MTTIATIGAGHIGTAVARIALAAGYDVVLSNSRGPETLTDLVAELGPSASADTPVGAATRGDLVVVTIPLRAIGAVPVEPLAGKIVVDTKAFNHIQSTQLESEGTPAGTPGRRALALFGDDAGAVDTVSRWLDELGYDAVQGGALAESWRIEPGSPGYGPRNDADGLRQALADATR